MTEITSFGEKDNELTVEPLKGIIFRNGRTDDLDQKLLFKAALSILGAIAVLFIVLTPLVMFFSGGSMSYYLFEVVGFWWLGSLFFTVCYDVMRDRKYFFGDLPVYDNWNFVLFLGLVPMGLPFFVISQRRMELQRNKNFSSDCDIRRKKDLLVLNLRSQVDSAEESAKRLKDYHLALWRSNSNADRVYLTNQITEAQKELKLYQNQQEELAERIADKQSSLQDYEKLLAKLPEYIEPVDKIVDDAEGCYRRIVSIPEVIQVEPQEGALEIILHFTCDHKHDLGYCAISLTDRRDESAENQGVPTIGFRCRHIHSGLTTQGQLEHPELEGQSFLAEVAYFSNAQDIVKKGSLDQAVESFVEEYYRRKLADIPEDQMNYVFLDLAS